MSMILDCSLSSGMGELSNAAVTFLHSSSGSMAMLHRVAAEPHHRHLPFHCGAPLPLPTTTKFTTTASVSPVSTSIFNSCLQQICRSYLLRTRAYRQKGVIQTLETQEEKNEVQPMGTTEQQQEQEQEQELVLFEGTMNFEFEHGYSMSTVCDRLIEVLLTEKTRPKDWNRLLAPSQEWRRIRPYFFKRCKHKAAQKKETDPKKAAALLNLAKKLKKIDTDMERHNKLLAYVQEHWPELDVMVAGRRNDFSNDFFRHIELLCDASHDRLDKRDGLARVAAKCLAAVEAHDSALADDVAIATAQKKFDNILDSASLDEACEKIDVLAKKKQLNSALMLLITKTWAAAKDSDKMNNEMKDLMHYIYMVARGNIQKMIPKEVRILQRILSFEDLTQRFAALTEAFSPGSDDIETTTLNKRSDSQHLHTKPERLLKWIKIILDAYHHNRQGSLVESARDLMTPLIISRLQILKDIVEDQFMHSSSS